jgi:hypothetical protein
MRVSPHAEMALIALGSRMPVPASVVIDRLRKMESPNYDNSFAIAVCKLQSAVGHPAQSNGDMVVVIIRRGGVITAMLRRSSQPFSPDELDVDDAMWWSMEKEKVA